MNIKKQISISAVFLLFSVLLHAAPDEKIRINLKWFYQYQFAGMIMAKELGYYAQEGLDVTLVERNPDKDHIMQVIDGEAEYGISDSSLLMYRAKGYPVKIVSSIFQHNAMVLIAKTESNIVSPYEMKGKRVSYQEGIDDAIFGSMFHFANITPKDFIKIPMDFTYERFISDEIDVIAAYITDQPYWIEKRGYNVNIINPLSYGIDLYGDILFTTDREVIEHPERIEKVKRATLKGWKYALEHKEETIATIRSRYKPSLSHDQLMYEAKATERLIAPKFVALGHTSIDRFKMIAEIFSQMNVPDDALKKAVNELIYDPLDDYNAFEHYLKLLVIAIAVILIAVFLLYLNNKRLQKMVDRQTLELSSFNEKIKKLIDMQTSMVLLTDSYSSQFANQAFFDFFAVTSLEEFASRYGCISGLFSQDSRFFSPEGTDSWIDAITTLPKQNRIVAMPDANAREHIFSVSVRQFDEKNFIVNFTDISSTVHEQIKLETRITHDALTGAYNREYFDVHFSRILDAIALQEKVMGVVMVDIDHFKQINDTFGHNCGDDTLIEFTKRIWHGIRRTDTFIRWGGEEFLMLLPVCNIDELGTICEHVRTLIASKPFEHVGNVTCSFGCTLLREHETGKDAIARADTALYQAKSLGRNRVESI